MTAVGIEWLIDASGCRPESLRDADVLRRVCEDVLRGLDLKVVGAGVWHRFPGPGAGLTGLYLLTESHLTCHTYPEVGLASFNLYCCRARPRWPWEEALGAALGAGSVEVRSVSRGALAGASGFLPSPPEVGEGPGVRGVAFKGPAPGGQT